MQVTAYCSECEKKVDATVCVSEEHLDSVLDTDLNIEVMHMAQDGEHRWTISKQEKQHLRKARGLED